MADVTRELQIVISAKDEASATLNKLLGSANNAFKTLGKIGVTASATIGAFAVAAGMSAARTDELTLALHAVAKANDLSTKTVDDTVEKLRDFNISHEKALQVTALFVQSQLDVADAVKVANAAKDLAVIAGLDSSEATRTLTEAIAAQEPMLLRQFGIVTTLPETYDKYGESIGKAGKDLDETEKKQALLNTILEGGEKVAGTYEAAMESVSKRFRSLTGRIIPDFIAEVGKAFTPTLTVVIDAISNSIEDMGKWVKENEETIKEWGEKGAIAATKILETFSKVVNFLMENEGIVLGVLAAFAFGMGILAVNVVLATWPILAIIAAFALLGLGIQKLMEAMPAINKKIEEVKTAFLEFGAKVQSTIENVILWFQQLPERAGAFIYDLFINQIPYAIGFVAGFLYSAIPSLIENVINWFQQLPGRVLTIFNQVKDFIILKITEALEWLKKELTALPGRVETYIKSIPGIVKGIFEAAKKWVLDTMESMFKGVSDWWDKIKGIFDALVGAANKAADAVRRGFEAGKNIDKFEHGGFVPGPFSQAVPAILHGGERVIPRLGADVSQGGGGGGVTINITGSFNLDSESRVEELADRIIRILGRQNELASKGIGI